MYPNFNFKKSFTYAHSSVLMSVLQAENASNNYLELDDVE